ncbi:MAG: Ig-like domain-containing protein [Prevotellaceae bacterium]|jgi:uncharacterized protein YjdB|nr:Ig-like domain-containing protein [Prevotellaceae bacterium]
MKKVLLALATGIAIMVSCSNKETVTGVTEVTGVSLDKSELSLVYGETVTLVATVAPDNATNKTVSCRISRQTTER